ncbi:magnesium transporter CorA family protein [Thalassolituus sp.]|uniref:magnesium transporter CorA family protein n=1 Tax=Thalassolituus sp. TaxID=2030822 RepID=UPI003514D943
MIRTLLTYKNGKSLQGGLELIDEWRSKPDTYLWLDLEAESEERELEILKSMNCHPLAIHDAQRPRHPPKIEEFSNYTFILYRGIASFSAELEHEAQTIALFVGKNILITRHPKEALSVNRMFNDTGAAQLRMGAGHLALKIMHTSAGIYLDALLEFESHLSDIEDSLVTNGNDELMRELMVYRSRLVKLRRLFNYHRNITDELRSEEYDLIAISDEPMRHAITDLHDRFDRLYTMTEMFYSICGDLIDGYLSIASHQLNRTMQVLTVITAIFIPLGFLAGLYGMNFEYIPELHAKNGYFYLLGVMGMIAVGLLVLFRKIRWL